MNKNLYKKQKLDTSKYVNTETGQLLSDEQPNITSVNKIQEDLVIIHSDNYFIVDEKALSYVKEHFSPAELDKITTMMKYILGEYNILHRTNRTAYTKREVNELFDLHINKFNIFMRKLFHHNIIYYLLGSENKKKVTYVMFNPNVARKRKTFNKGCTSVFKSF